jgi:hypothetical protein
MAEPVQSEPVRHLGLLIDTRDWVHGAPSQPIVTILVDGQEIFARVAGQGYQGWHPAAILDPDMAPMLPRQPARRVGLYGWDSYYGPGEGCLAAVIEDRGDRIIWSNLRDYCGPYDRPLPEDDPDPLGGKHMGIADLAFDAAQYRAEVARVSAGLPWETGHTKTMRLLERFLGREKDRLARLGWKLDFVQRGPSGYWIAFTDADDVQTIVELDADPGPPAGRATAMASFLFTTPPPRWPVAHCSLCDYGPDPSVAEGPRAPYLPPPEDHTRHPAHGPSTDRARRLATEAAYRARSQAAGSPVQSETNEPGTEVPGSAEL